MGFFVTVAILVVFFAVMGWYLRRRGDKSEGLDGHVRDDPNLPPVHREGRAPTFPKEWGPPGR